jgi:hypothetical protein
MPPLNNLVFDEPLLVNRTTINSVRSESSSSFERELDCEDPLLKFAFSPRRQKSVSFNHQVEVKYLPSHYDWSEDEKISRWNSEDDYTNFQLDIFNTVYLLRNDPQSIDDTCHSSRGVECRDPIARRRRRQLKQEAWCVVFERQRIQRQMNDETSGYNYLVASMYCHATQTAMRLALDFAAQDEIDANKIIREENQRQNEEMEFFDHSWIGTIASSNSENSSLNSSSELSSGVNNNEEFGFCVWGEQSGFDNSWLRVDV